MIHISEDQLKKLLFEGNVVSSDDFESAKAESLRSDRTVQNILIGRRVITEEYFTEVLAKFFNVETVDLKRKKISDVLLKILSEDFIKSKRAVIFEEDKAKRIYSVAMEDPGDIATIQFLREKTGYFIKPYLTSRESFVYSLKYYRRDIEKDFYKIIQETAKNVLEQAGKVSADSELQKLAVEYPVVTILDSIMEYGILFEASDIHFERLPDKVLVRFRTEGILRDIVTLPKEIHSVLVARIKILSSLEIDEHFKPQDGRFKFVTEDQMVDVRVSVMPTFYGERVVFRLLKGSFGPLTLPELGISDESLKLVENNISKTFGMFLVTGPTGSGKTTTLYAILHILNTPAVNIATVEDPIEYAILRVNQTQVNPKAGITFASGLKSLVRQNPDILMVGEIRDMETADISIHASLTGHLLLSTLHASDAPTAIPRLINMGVEPYLLASTLNAIIAQRLIRKICQYCVESYEVPKDAMALIEKELNLSRAGIAKENFEIPHRLFRGKGCEKCNHSGFAGQSGIFEVFSVDTDIRDMITRNASLTDLKKAAIQKGMVPMFEDGLRKAEKGITSIEEVLRVVRE